jgi:hypothetical protein
VVVCAPLFLFWFNFLDGAPHMLPAAYNVVALDSMTSHLRSQHLDLSYPPLLTTL